MMAFLMDEISPSHMKKIAAFLDKNATPSHLDHLFWVPIPRDLLNETQFQHENCRPHVFALELGPDWVKMEFFVRSLSTMRCECQAYCTAQQRDYVIRFAHEMIHHLRIRA